MVLQIVFLLWLTKALVVAAASQVAMDGCQDRCGNVVIPYPFGIGPIHCYIDEWFEVTCNNTVGSPSTPKPFIKSINLEVLNISLKNGTIRVNNPVLTSNCPRRTDRLQVNLTGSPFSFNNAYSRFAAMGCDNLAVFTQQGTTIGGCMSICGNGSVTSCYGIDCCQTTIPPFLNFINASLDSIHPNNDDEKTCKHAFMVDQRWFNNLTDPYAVQRMKSVPVVLDWVISNGTCDSFGTNTTSTANSSFCSNYSYCSRNRSLTSSFQCFCDSGYDGNPYLSDGCQDIDECLDANLNRCYYNCTNTLGDYRCLCFDGSFENMTRSVASLDADDDFKYYYRRSQGYYCYTPERDKSKRTKMKAIIIGFGTAFGSLFLLIGLWWLWKIVKRRKQTKQKEKFFKRNGGLLLEQQMSSNETNVEKTKVFTSKELEKATDYYNEDRILGQGGQGTVYKGMLTDGRIVAVKRSKMVDESNLEQFINEVVILSQINHRNVVKLLGCCLETEVPMLVYEFISNGTLSQYIHDQSDEFPLSWDIRLRIATEVAGALSYLHYAASIPIYHRDIKSTNILLDEKYKAKVSDFGTSRSIAIDQTHLTTLVHGTFGYLDPEYFQSSQFTEKSDVYSFGVVLVELLTGQKPISFTRSQESRSLATYFMLAIEENDLFDILDARVVKEGGKEEIMVVANLAKRCLNLNGKKRPTMKEVAVELEGIRMSHGASTMRENNEQDEYVVAEINGPWDYSSTSTRSCLDNSASSSLDAKPLLFN